MADTGFKPLLVAITPADTDRGLNELVQRNPAGELIPRIGQLAGLESAEIALYPHPLAEVLEAEDGLDTIIEVVKRNSYSRLKTLLLLRHDHFKPLQIGQPDVVVLRDSMVGKLEYVSEYSIPGAVNTRGLFRGMHSIREYSEVPTIGFMGSVALTSLPRHVAKFPERPPVGFTTMKEKGRGILAQPLDIGALLRSQALDALAASDLVNTHIVKREAYHGRLSQRERELHRAEYLQHFSYCDYILCIRGAGNYSHRLFETLAMGRIPIILDTDMVMPFRDRVNWEDVGVWVPLSKIGSIAEVVADFHAKLTPEKFKNLQIQSDEIYWGLFDRIPFRRYLEKFLIGVVRNE